MVTERREISDWLRQVRFKKELFGGVNENDIWKKLEDFSRIYDPALKSSKDYLSLCQSDARNWIDNIKFKKKFFCGANEADVKKKLDELDGLYQTAAENEWFQEKEMEPRENPLNAIRKRRSGLNDRKSFLDLIVRIAMTAAMICFVFTNVFLITQNHGLGMFPALKDGDLIIAYRLQENYAKNDVIVCEIDGKQRVARIVAQGGDAVIIDEGGSLRVNGTVQSGDIMYPTYAKEGLEYPYEVPKNHVFLLGDYRTNTEDSRDYGAVPMEQVKGKVISIFRRRDL